MKNRHALAWLTSIVLLLTAASAALAEDRATVQAEDVGMSSERLARLSAAMDGYVDRDELAGGVVLVMRRGHVVFHEAFGERDRASSDAMEADDMFRIASQTKAIVSTAIMILEEEGKLLISHPVSRYLPAYEQTTVAEDRDNGRYEIVPAERPVTLRDSPHAHRRRQLRRGTDELSLERGRDPRLVLRRSRRAGARDDRSHRRASVRRPPRRALRLWLLHRHPRRGRGSGLGDAASTSFSGSASSSRSR